MTMFCKYCGKEIAEDSIYCSWCGKNITKTTDPIQKIKVEDAVQVVLKEEEKQKWQSAENLNWQKPYVAKLFQIILILLALSSMIYGIVWCAIGGKRDGLIPPPSYNNSKNRYELLLYKTEPLGIIDVYVDLNELENGKYFDNWQDALKQLYERLYGQNYYYNKTSLSRIIEGCVDPPYEISKYYYIADKHATNLFRSKTIILIIFPALILFAITIVWMRKTRFPNSKDKLPRDFADKIEVYSWSGFRVPKYVFFQKDNKYGVIDASKYSVVIPAKYDSVIWREQNVSFDATINNEKETVIINNQLINSQNLSDLKFTTTNK